MTYNPLSELSNEELRKIRDRIRQTKINVLLVGGTGVGKSSTINALFQSHEKKSDAVVGEGTTPETMEIGDYALENLVIWDTPGLGDSPEKDKAHQEKIVDLLHRKDENNQPLIDLVFLILDAGSRDFSSAYILIRDVILPNLDESDQNRILIGLNQADQAMKGHYWNKEENKPESKLVERLDELSQTVKNRIKNDTGLDIDPIYYSAGCMIGGEVLSRPYNLQKLLSFILDRLPKKKRVTIAFNINKNEANFQSNDGKDDYHEKAEQSIWNSIKEIAKDITEKLAKELGDIIIDPNNIKLAITTLLSLIKKAK
ncbi:GTPase [Salinicola sp. LHM]|uniref:GTPase family protein n=1 Tax=Salinicola sp. LHM TaxID=3065298 RepID=UPI002ACDA06A|nr:GTPase [Salinicola sp. LHM]WQH32423.1 GTPase [Salinicola sp. LHM]